MVGSFRVSSTVTLEHVPAKWLKQPLIVRTSSGEFPASSVVLTEKGVVVDIKDSSDGETGIFSN